MVKCWLCLTEYQGEACPKCGTKNRDKTKPISSEYSIKDIISAIIGIPFFIIGFALITLVIIGTLMNGNITGYSLIGMLFGIIFGAIPAKIGEYILKTVKNESIRTGGMGIGVIGGVIFGITQLQSYLSYF